MPELLTAPAGASSAPEQDSLIASLWVRHQAASGRQRRARKVLARIRAELGARLAEAKARLVGAGREGEWGLWLLSHDIPRATADRLVARHLDPDPEPPPALAARPFPQDLEGILNLLLHELRCFSLQDRFRCLEALGPALELVCRHRGRYGDLLIEAPPEEDPEDGGPEDEDPEQDGSSDNASELDEAEDSGSGEYFGLEPRAGSTAATIPAFAARPLTPRPAVDSFGSSSSLRNFFRRRSPLAVFRRPPAHADPEPRMAAARRDG